MIFITRYARAACAMSTAAITRQRFGIREAGRAASSASLKGIRAMEGGFQLAEH